VEHVAELRAEARVPGAVDHPEAARGELEGEVALVGQDERELPLVVGALAGAGGGLDHDHAHARRVGVGERADHGGELVVGDVHPAPRRHLVRGGAGAADLLREGHGAVRCSPRPRGRSAVIASAPCRR